MSAWSSLDSARLRIPTRRALTWLAIGLAAALSVAAMRVDGIRMRYELARSMSLEQELLESQRTLTVAMRRLRDPARLAERARSLGFTRPERVIDLLAEPPSPTTFAARSRP